MAIFVKLTGLLGQAVRSPVILTLGLQGCAHGLLLLFTVLIARAVSVDVYGEFIFGFQIGQTLASVLALGATFYLSKVNAEYPDTHEGRCSTYRYQNFFLYRGLLLLTVFVLVFMVTGQSRTEISSFGISAANFVPIMLMAYMIATGRAPLGNLIQAGRSLALCAAVVASLVMSGDKPLEFALLLAVAYSVGISLLAGVRYSFQARKRSSIGQFEFGRQHVLTVILAGADVLILKFVSTPEDLANYGVAFFLSSIASFALYAINANYTAKIARSFKQESINVRQDLLRNAAKTNLMLSVPFLVVLVVVGLNLTVIYGPEYSLSELLFLILLLGQSINLFVGSVALVANVSGHEFQVTKFVSQSLLVKVVLGFFAAYAYGAVGMAVVTSLSTALWNVRAYIFVRKELQLDTTPLSLLRGA